MKHVVKSTAFQTNPVITRVKRFVSGIIKNATKSIFVRYYKY